ncbi:TPA: Odorant-binding protein-like [Bos taurus]|nr:TPA: Odorant-binding protein-like [Bos taurus]
MKVLVLSLLLGLVCDAQEADDQKGLSQLSGKWRTVYIASTIPDKIAENGPFRAYLCYLVFDDEQGTVDFYFYVKLNGEWVAKHVTGKKTKNNTYVVEYEGENKFEVIYASDTVLVVSVVNKDKNKRCGEIQLAAIFVKVNDIEEKALEIFKELLKLKRIEEKYIVNFFESEEPPNAALPAGVVIVRKQERALSPSLAQHDRHQCLYEAHAHREHEVHPALHLLVTKPVAQAKGGVKVLTGIFEVKYQI